MAQVKLEMEFADEMGKSHKVRLSDPRSDLTDTEVFSVMDQVITSNALKSKNGELKSKLGARIVTTSIEDFEIE